MHNIAKKDSYGAGFGMVGERRLTKAELSKMSREARPIKAAERRQILAPGVSPGFSGPIYDEPRRGERFLANLSPLRGSALNDTLTTAFSRGYNLSPLRGSITMRLFAATFVPVLSSKPT